jgi:hypothetical protein
MATRACGMTALIVAIAATACGGESDGSGNGGGKPSGDASTQLPDAATGSDGGNVGSGGAPSEEGGSGASGDGGGGAGPSDDGGTDAVEPGGDASDGGVVASGPDIDVGSSELIFSAFLGKTSLERPLVVRNVGSGPLEITSFTFSGPQKVAFSQVAAPATPLQIAAGAETTLRFVFSPGAQAPLGVEQGSLQIASNDPDEAKVDIALWALATKAAQGENEPPLKQIVDTLGFAIDVGGTMLSLGTGANPIGDEVRAPLFKRVAPGLVTLKPVARYSPDEPVPFGYYTPGGGTPTLHEVAVLVMGQEQTLYPGIQPGGKSDFDPGDMPFGLYSNANKHVAYTEDALNTTAVVKHSARTYPMKDRAGKAVPNTYMVGFEEAANGDYNDTVYVIGNVTPVP